MTRGQGIYDDESADEPKGGRPGPKDEGREGGMATRENTPDVAEGGERADGLTLLGVATLAAAPVGGPPEVGQPSGSNSTSGSLCTVGSNAKSPTSVVDGVQCQPGQRPEIGRCLRPARCRIRLRSWRFGRGSCRGTGRRPDMGGQSAPAPTTGRIDVPVASGSRRW